MDILELIKSLVEKLGGDEVSNYQARQNLSALIADLGKQDAGKIAAVAKGLADALGATVEGKDGKGNKTVRPKLSAKVRCTVLRFLGGVAGEAEVPAIRKAMEDLETREPARVALDRVPGQAAADALIDAAVNGLGVEYRVGAINSLARRPDNAAAAQVAEALTKLAADGEAEVRLAAAEAAALIAQSGSEAVIEAAGKDAAGRALARIGRSFLRLAETLAAKGGKEDAKKIADKISAGNFPEATKKAAKALFPAA